MTTETKMPEAMTAGAAWVSRFLLPRLNRRFPTSSSISCLQLWPDDPTETQHLEKSGHRCEMLEPKAGGKLARPDSSCDFIFTGQFTLRAPDRTARIALAKEFNRVLRSGGSLLLAMGNRACPVDLTRNGPRFHGPGAPSCLSLREAREILLEQAGFATLEPLGAYGHFGWGSLPGVFRPFGKVLDAYWRLLMSPSLKGLYGSPLNPTLLLWLNKN